MNPNFHFDHFNINVSNLERSLDFYSKALGLKESGEIVAKDGSFIIKYLTDESSSFRLELTWLKDHPQNYELGENESHLALRTNDFTQAHQLHSDMGCICFENPQMGIYFINDPDDYWIEILPPKK